MRRKARVSSRSRRFSVLALSALSPRSQAEFAVVALLDDR